MAFLPNNFNWWDEGTNTGNIYEGNLSHFRRHG